MSTDIEKRIRDLEMGLNTLVSENKLLTQLIESTQKASDINGKNVNKILSEISKINGTLHLTLERITNTVGDQGQLEDGLKKLDGGLSEVKSSLNSRGSQIDVICEKLAHLEKFDDKQDDRIWKAGTFITYAVIGAIVAAGIKFALNGVNAKENPITGKVIQQNYAEKLNKKASNLNKKVTGPDE